ncbi:MAG: MFS transporter [Saprospiraceae bacterium]
MKYTKAYSKTLLILVIITAVAIDVSIPVLPIITEHFGVETSQSQLIISSFLAGYGLFMIPLGLISDRYGRLPVIYFGLILYVLAGFVVAFAWRFEVVLLGRFLQGIGGGVGAVIARAVARDLCTGKALAKLMSAIVTALAITTLVSPLIGSFLYTIWGWQATFLVSPILGLIVLIGVWLTAFETVTKQQNPINFQQQLIGSSKIFFEAKNSVWALWILVGVFSGHQIILTNASLLMVDIYGMKAGQVGLIFGLASGCYIAFNFLNSYLLKKSNPIALLRYGIMLISLSAIGLVFCQWVGDLPFWVIWFFCCLFVASMGFLFPNTNIIAMDPLPQIAGFASSILGAFMIMGGAIATAIAANFYNSTVFSITAAIIFCSLFTTIIYFIKPNAAKPLP